MLFRSNNCCGVTTVDDLVIPNVLEVTFLNKKYVQRKNQIIDLPNSLDKKNVEKKKEQLMSMKKNKKQLMIKIH